MRPATLRAVLNGVERGRLALPERGVELALIDWGGAGPRVLLAHANGFCAALWDGVARRLRERFRVFGFDARGHGDSSRPPVPDAYGWGEFGLDVAAVAERIPGEGPIYGIGHSFGGTSVLGAAALRPDLFGRVALVDPVLYPLESEHTPERQQRKTLMVEAARRRRTVWPSRAEVRAAYAQRELFASWDPAALDLYVEEGFRERDDGQVELKCHSEVEAAVFAASGAAELDIYGMAERLAVPALLVWAQRGGFDRSVYEKLSALAPEMRIEDAPLGHLMPMEAPQAVAEMLVGFGQEG